MGGNICKSCDNFSKVEEKNLSENLNNRINIYNISPNYGPVISTIKKRPMNSVNNEIVKTTIMKTATKNDELIAPSPKVVVDEKEIEKVIYRYHINLLISTFRQFKKLKDEAHKIIEMRNNMKEKRNLLYVEGNDSLDVDLFPEEHYNYLGNIFNNKEDGFGVQYFPESSAKYVGHFLNGRRINYCIFEDKSKFYIYKGEIKKNFTGSYGIYYNYEKGIIYEGDWVNNRKDGLGIETYKDGSKYEGEHKNGVKHGIGTYFWDDGSRYEGEWKYNLMDGYGIYKFKDGSICSGFWLSNQMNGFGKFTFPEIKCYLGYFKKDYKNGFGLIFWFKEKKAFVGYWKNNKQEGLGKFMHEGKIRYGSWKEGKKESKFEENEFYKLLNEKNINTYDSNIFQMDYDSLKNYIQSFDFF